MSNNDELGELILGILRQSPDVYYELKRINTPNSSKVYPIVISLDGLKKSELNARINVLCEISKLLVSWFRNKMYERAIIDKERHRVPFKVTIESYLDLFDISEDELSSETLRRDFSRKKRKIINKLTNRAKILENGTK